MEFFVALMSVHILRLRNFRGGGRGSDWAKVDYVICACFLTCDKWWCSAWPSSAPGWAGPSPCRARTCCWPPPPSTSCCCSPPHCMALGAAGDQADGGNRSALIFVQSLTSGWTVGFRWYKNWSNAVANYDIEIWSYLGNFKLKFDSVKTKVSSLN